MIHALHVEARLSRREPTGLRRSRGIESEITVLPAAEVFPLQLEVGVSRVEVRRPFQDSVQHPETALAREAVACPGWIVKGAVLGRGAQVREAGLPRGARSKVSADVRENVA